MLTTSSGSNPNLSVIGFNFSGLKEPSVLIYNALSAAPPFSPGNWHVTYNVWHIWVFPNLNSPNNSVIESLSIPPPYNLSNSDEPVVKYTKFFLFSKYMLLGVKPIWHIIKHASIIFSTFISERPFIILKFFLLSM